MKVNLRQLKQIIRETVEEVATPGDERYSMAGDARGGVRGGRNSRGVSFPGHSDASSSSTSSSNVNQQGLSSPGGSYVPSGVNQQGLSSPGGSYVQGSGWVPSSVADDAADAADADMPAGSDPKEEFFLLIDSQVTRGNEGNIEHVPSGNIFTAQGDKSMSGSMLGDLNMSFQKSSRKSAKDRSRDVIKILMDYDLLGQQDIDDELVSEIGIKGRDSGQIWPIEEYFMEYNNKFINECKRLMKKVLR